MHMMGLKVSHQRSKVDQEVEKFESEIRHRPESLAALCEQTGFSRREIQTLYRGFKEACPRGVIDMVQFKELFSTWFPSGIHSEYANYVFRTFDKNRDDVINFQEFVMGLAVLSRGSEDAKLKWIFSLYDTDDDGVITPDELLRIVTSVNDMMGSQAWPPVSYEDCKRHSLDVFKKMDENNDGRITIDEFLHVSKTDPVILESLHVFDTVFYRKSIKKPRLRKSFSNVID